jgi:hypothetical protein
LNRVFESNMLKGSSKDWMNADYTQSFSWPSPWKSVNKFKLWGIIKWNFINKIGENFVPLLDAIVGLCYYVLGCHTWFMVYH